MIPAGRRLIAPRRFGAGSTTGRLARLTGARAGLAALTWAALAWTALTGPQIWAVGVQAQVALVEALSKLTIRLADVLHALVKLVALGLTTLKKVAQGDARADLH